jgi:hypothetical protein
MPGNGKPVFQHVTLLNKVRDVLLAALQPRAENLLRRSGFLDEVGNERIFWSADRAILSLGGDLPAAPKDAPEEDNLDSTLVVTPHEERSAKKF